MEKTMPALRELAEPPDRALKKRLLGAGTPIERIPKQPTVS